MGGPLLWLSKPIVGDVSVWWWAPLLPACHCFKHQMVKMVYDAAGLMRKQKGFVLFEKKKCSWKYGGVIQAQHNI